MCMEQSDKELVVEAISVANFASALSNEGTGSSGGGNTAEWPPVRRTE